MVFSSLRRWARDLRASHSGVRRIGIFGSYARGDYTPASDVDIVLVVSRSDTAMWKRPLDYPPPSAPVGAEVIVYTEDEIARAADSPWLRRILAEVHWLEGD